MDASGFAMVCLRTDPPGAIAAARFCDTDHLIQGLGDSLFTRRGHGPGSRTLLGWDELAAGRKGISPGFPPGLQILTAEQPPVLELTAIMSLMEATPTW